MKTLKKRGLCGGLKRNRMGNKWTLFFLCNVLFWPLFLGRHLAHGGEVVNEEKMCEAIYRSEGGDRTNYPYGIKSVSCATKMECKAVCIKTMRHYKKDFARHGGHGVKNFIKYASFRYVGLRDRTREAWEKNVNFYCKKQGGCYE